MKRKYRTSILRKMTRFQKYRNRAVDLRIIRLAFYMNDGYYEHHRFRLWRKNLRLYEHANLKN